MTKFTQLAPAKAISAQQLDENFRQVAPAENQDLRQVRLQRGQDGWKIEVFPEFPFETAMLASSGDMPFWLSVSELLNELVNAGLVAEIADQLNNGGTVSAGSVGGGANLPDIDELHVSIIKPGPTGSEEAVEDYIKLPELLDELTDEQKLTLINALLATLDSDNGGVTLREVERCDGKRMKVLGTLWYDP